MTPARRMAVAILLRLAVDGPADRLQESALGIRMRRVRTQGEREDGVELAKLHDEILGALPELLARGMEPRFLMHFQCPNDMKPG